MRTSKRTRARKGLVKDLFLVIIGGVVAILLSKYGLIDTAISLLGSTVIASFFAGIFFTSIFTVAPASVALADIFQASGSLHTIALCGALGAMIGDFIIFYFIRDHFMDDLTDSFRPSITKHIMSSFHFGFLKWLSPVLGAAIIASPLPDEMGLALMGISKIRTIVMLPISFVMNAVGIYAIIWFAQVI